MKTIGTKPSSKKRKRLFNQSLTRFDEHLISRILSKLPTKQAVRSSLLSKSWRSGWTSISNLDFSDFFVGERSEFTEEGYVAPPYHADRGYWVDTVKDALNYTDFTEYVTNVLSDLKTTSIDKFSVSLSDPFKHSYFLPAGEREHKLLRKWIRAALKLNVKHLKLQASSPPLPEQGKYDFKSLESLVLKRGVYFRIEADGFLNLKVLKLTSVVVHEIPDIESPCFPILETLHLRDVMFSKKNGGSVMKLYRHCPALKTFRVATTIDYRESDLEYLNAPRLERADLWFPDDVITFDVQIGAEVKCVKLFGVTPSHRILINSPHSLEKVDLTILDRYRTPQLDAPVLERATPEQQVENVRTLINSFHSVKYLCLRSESTADEIKKWLTYENRHIYIDIQSPVELPLFTNLIQLTLAFHGGIMSLMQSFMSNSPNLKVLVILKSRCYFKIHGEDGWSSESSDAPICFNSLESVEIWKSDGCNCEIGLVKYILQQGRLLKRLAAMSSCFEEEEEITTLGQRISTFPRASACCEVDYEKTIIEKRRDVQLPTPKDVIESKWSFR